MAINKAVRAALKALSYPDLDMVKNYKAYRQVINLAHKHYMKPFYRTWDHEIVFEDHSIPVRIFSPDDDIEDEEDISAALYHREGDKYPMLLFFHGGGWVTGNIDSYDKVCTNMARLTDRIVVSVDYRLAPEYKFPAAPDDCYRVAREIYMDESLFGVEHKNITIIGDSAGANLAAVVSLMARDRGEFAVDNQILIYPATYNDHSSTSRFQSVRDNGTDYLLTSKRICDYMELYLQSEEDKYNPYFAPLLAEDLSSQPKTLVITAEYDPLRDEGEAYGERLRQAGNYAEIHRIADGLHGFFSLPPRFPQVAESYKIINNFLSKVN